MYQFVVLIILLLIVNLSLRKECKEKYLITPLISKWQSVYLSCLLITYVTTEDQTSANVDISQKSPGKYQERGEHQIKNNIARGKHVHLLYV